MTYTRRRVWSTWEHVEASRKEYIASRTWRNSRRILLLLPSTASLPPFPALRAYFTGFLWYNVPAPSSSPEVYRFVRFYRGVTYGLLNRPLRNTRVAADSRTRRSTRHARWIPQRGLLPVLDIYRAVRRPKWIACLFFQTLSSFSFPTSSEILQNSSSHLAPWFSLSDDTCCRL